MPTARRTRAATTVPSKGRIAADGATSASAASPAGQIDALTGDPNFMSSLARGLAVVRAFSQQRRELTIAELSRATEIPRAAVRRCLYTLGKLGYVGSTDGRAYSLRPRILALGHAYLSSTPLATSAQPLLDQISAAVHESSSMAVLEGDDILYIARSSTTTRLMSIDLGIGSRLPAYCTSLGRVLLAGLARTELDAYLARASLLRRTARTVTAPAELRRLLAVVKRDGYAIVDQELEIGLRSMAVPVHDITGKCVAAINIGTQSARVSVAEMLTRFLTPLQAAANELGMLLVR